MSINTDENGKIYGKEREIKVDDEVFKAFLNEYYDQFNGKEATLDEFLLLLETSTGVDGTIEWFELMLSSLGNFSRRP